MKKTLSLLLVLLLTLGLFAACQKLEERTDGTAPADAASEVLLPMGLEFGMTYEEFTAKLAENGFTFASWETPTDHRSDTGFDSPFLLLSGTDDLPLDCTFLHSPSLSAAWGADSSMNLTFSFDENRALYKVSCDIRLMKDADTVRSEIESFLDGFFPPNSRKSRIEYGWDYESPANHAMLFSMSFISYVFETKAGVKLSGR